MVVSPKYCGKHETLHDAAIQMFKANIGSLPVVDENKKLVGIITDRDICLAAANSDKKNLSEVKVHEVINRGIQVHTVTPEDDLQTALRIMRIKKVGRLPVVDREQTLQGIVSLNHILRKTHGSDDEAEVEYAGDENVIKTLHALANRKLEIAF